MLRAFIQVSISTLHFLSSFLESFFFWNPVNVQGKSKKKNSRIGVQPPLPAKKSWVHCGWRVLSGQPCRFVRNHRKKNPSFYALGPQFPTLNSKNCGIFVCIAEYCTASICGLYFWGKWCDMGQMIQDDQWGAHIVKSRMASRGYLLIHHSLPDAHTQNDLLKILLGFSTTHDFQS